MACVSSLVDLSKAGKNDVTLPNHLSRALPLVNSGDRVATQVFLAEALKPNGTGKHTSTTRDDSFMNAAVAFIEKWKAIRPLAPLAERQRR